MRSSRVALCLFMATFAGSLLIVGFSGENGRLAAEQSGALVALPAPGGCGMSRCEFTIKQVGHFHQPADIDDETSDSDLFEGCEVDCYRPVGAEKPAANRAESAPIAVPAATVAGAAGYDWEQIRAAETDADFDCDAVEHDPCIGVAGVGACTRHGLAAKPAALTAARERFSVLLNQLAPSLVELLGDSLPGERAFLLTIDMQEDCEMPAEPVRSRGGLDNQIAVSLAPSRALPAAQLWLNGPCAGLDHAWDLQPVAVRSPKGLAGQLVLSQVSSRTLPSAHLWLNGPCAGLGNAWDMQPVAVRSRGGLDGQLAVFQASSRSLPAAKLWLNGPVASLESSLHAARLCSGNGIWIERISLSLNPAKPVLTVGMLSEWVFEPVSGLGSGVWTASRQAVLGAAETVSGLIRRSGVLDSIPQQAEETNTDRRTTRRRMYRRWEL
jgi:phage shock protein PspC (stress-responsive transcriptional regulator)